MRERSGGVERTPSAKLTPAEGERQLRDVCGPRNNEQRAAERHTERRDQLLLQTRPQVEQFVHPPWGDPWRRWMWVHDGLAQPHQQLGGIYPMEEIARAHDAQSSGAGQRTEAAFGVAREVMVQDIVRRPQQQERRDGRHEHASWLKQRHGVTQGPAGVAQVLDNVEHQNERIPLPGLETRIERADLNAGPVFTGLTHDRGIGFATLDIPQFAKAVEHQPIAATDVQNRTPPFRRAPATQGFEEESLTGPPPPVALVERAIVSRVLQFHVWSACRPADDAADDIRRPSLDLFVHSAHVLPDHTKEEQVDAREKGDEHGQRREATAGFVQSEFRVQRVEGEGNGKRDRNGAEHRRRPNGENREGEDPVEGPADTAPQAVFRRPGRSRRTLDRHGDLPKPYPAAQAAQEPMAFGGLPQRLDDALRHQPEVPRVEGNGYVRQLSENAVEEEEGEPQPPRFLALHTLGVYHIESRRVLRQEGGDQLGRILEVAIHDDDGVP